MASFVRTQDIEHELGEGGSFSLRVTSADVELRAADSAVARVRVTYDLRAGSDADADALMERVQLRVRRGPGQLELSEPRGEAGGIAALVKLFAGRGGAASFRVEAELPRGASVSYNGVSGELIAAGFHGDQQYRTVSGDLVLSDVTGSLRLHSVSGDVTVRGDGRLDLDASAVSGDLSILAAAFGELRASTVSGDIELEGELDAARTHRVDTVSGDLSLGLIGDLVLDVRGISTDVDIGLAHRAEGSRDRRRFVIGAGGPSLTFSSMSGDVTVHAPRRQRPRPDRSPQPPEPPEPPRPPNQPPIDEMEVLRAVERGEIDVDEAARRLAGGGHE